MLILQHVNNNKLVRENFRQMMFHTQKEFFFQPKSRFVQILILRSATLLGREIF